MGAGAKKRTKWPLVLAVLVVAGFAVFWLVTAPSTIAAAQIDGDRQPDLANGETIYNAGNCAGCHMSTDQDDRTMLGGGHALTSPFGTFIAPNISPDEEAGIGGWSDAQFVNAVKRGVGAEGEHLYPAFPYTAYAKLTNEDVLDLFAYIKTLPAVDTASEAHQVGFPYNIRRLLGGWKFLNFSTQMLEPDPEQSDAWNRGRYLVEAAGHCAECHTPRDALGGLMTDQLYAGAPSVHEGDPFAINITSSEDGLGEWFEEDFSALLSTGMNPCFNEPAGMADVLAGTMQLSFEDADAMAAYLKTLPPKPGNVEHRVC